MVVTRPLVPRHQELRLAGGAEQVRGQGPAVSQLVIAEDILRLLGPRGPELGEMLVTFRCAGMSPPPKINLMSMETFHFRFCSIIHEVRTGRWRH